MEVRIRVPLIAEIISQGLPVSVAHPGQSWSSKQLENYESKSGVYIHHSNGKILYVGKTTAKGKWGNFGVRFRRQFQQKASKNSFLYQLLIKQVHPIKTVMYDMDVINLMIVSDSVQLSKERKALMMEQVLIGMFEPEGNRDIKKSLTIA